MQKDINNLKLVLVGPDDGYKNELLTLIGELELESDVIMTGTLDGNDKLSAYVDGDVFVLPSSYESFGNVIFESLLCSTPVIVSRNCGSADIIDTASCGLTFKYGDVKDLRDKMDYLISNPIKGKEMIGNGQEYVKENLTHEKIISHIEEIYHSVIKK
jgi:glycosyltransferase involved in cell wall biosynthesis